MSSIRLAANAHHCTLRLRVCTVWPTELHHLRVFGRCGAGMKPKDREAVICCRSCHNLIHTKGWKGLEADLLRALLETHDVLERLGLLVCQ